jgi:FlaA1/EpsC-like NDP-sugar epimerase
MQMIDRILIVGAGEAGRILLSEFIRQDRASSVAGFVDDDPSKKTAVFSGKNVLGSRLDIPSIVRDFGVTRAIIALPSARTDIVKDTVAALLAADPSIAIEILPPFTRYFESSLSTSLQNIKLTDIIEREEYSLDISAIESALRGKRVLVTGAGGSIGSELVRQLSRFAPSQIVCVGRGENSIYQLIRSLEDAGLDHSTEHVFRICDVKDRTLLSRIFAAYRPQIVFHAAAHKHVPLMEYNEAEAVQNNVGGSLNVLGLSREYGAEKFVLVSTDKAVNPSNVMGATKRITELLAGYFFDTKALPTVVVRFGNVVGSRGSVIPLFKDQIEKGGPVTVTHPEITRFFMTIPEAVLLVLNAAAFSNGGETFVLNMGTQYKIDDIARRMIRLYGLEPERDIRIEYTGLRPGEKLYEEIVYGKEDLVPTANGKIFIMKGRERQQYSELEAFIDQIPAVSSMEPSGVRAEIHRVVAEFVSDTGRSAQGESRFVR